MKRIIPFTKSASVLSLCLASILFADDVATDTNSTNSTSTNITDLSSAITNFTPYNGDSSLYSMTETELTESEGNYVITLSTYDNETQTMVESNYLITFDNTVTGTTESSITGTGTPDTIYFVWSYSDEYKDYCYQEASLEEYESVVADGGTGLVILSNTDYTQTEDIDTSTLTDFDGTLITSTYTGVSYYYIEDRTESYSGDFFNTPQHDSSGNGTIAIGYGSSIIGEAETISGTFVDNYAGSTGAIYVYPGSSVGTITGNYISNKGGQNTGAIYNSGIIDSIEALFLGNEGYVNNAGAIFNASGAVINNITSDFIDNSTDGGYGGAIYNYFGTINAISGSNFIGNSAWRGGAIYGNNSSKCYIGEISDSSFISNVATGSNSQNATGGAISTAYGTLEAIKNCVFDSNSAVYSYDYDGGSYGGAIYFYCAYDDFLISGSSFTNNYAADLGGAIYFVSGGNYGCVMTLTGDYFANNASYYGGALYNGGPVSMSNTQFIDNSAVIGGAIFNYGEIDMTDIEFNGNTASYGGAIFNTGSLTCTITNSHDGGYWVYDNDAEYGGFLYAAEGSTNTLTVGYAEDGSLTEVTVKVHDNTATEAGGFIYAEAGSTNTFNIAEGSTVVVGDFAVSHSVDEDFEHTDSIYGEGGYTEVNEETGESTTVNGAAFVKNGGGVLLVHSNAEIQGSLAVNEGSVIIEGDLNDEDDTEDWYEYVLEYEESATALANLKANLMLGSPLILGESLSVGTVLDSYVDQLAGDSNTLYIASDAALVVHAHATGGTDSYGENTASIVGDGSSTVYVGNNSTLIVYGTIELGTTEIRIFQGFETFENIDDSAIFDSISDEASDTGDSDSAIADAGTASSDAGTTANATVMMVSNSASDSSSDDTTDSSSNEATDTATDTSSDLVANTGSDETTSMTTDTSSSDIPENTSGEVVEVNSFGFNNTVVLDQRVVVSSEAIMNYGEDGSTSFVLLLEENPEGIGNIAQMAAIAGVSSTMNTLVNSARDTTMARFSAFDKSYKGDPENEMLWGVWAIPMYTQSRARGLNAGTSTTGYDMNFGGVNMGADYTRDNTYRAGFALHAGGGKTESDGDFDYTDNDFDFYSATLYGGYKNGNFLLYGDLNLGYSRNDLTQTSATSTADSLVTADVDAFIYDASIRTEYVIDRKSYKLTPHAGVTYSYIAVDDYSAEQFGADIYNVNSHGQSLITIPIGVMFTTDIDLENEWTLSPIVDIGVIFNAGDLYAKSTASFEGFDTYCLSIEAYNRYIMQGMVGFELSKGQHRFGLIYEIESSENITTHNFRLNYRFEF